MQSIIKRVLDGNWSSIQADIEKMTSDKVLSRIQDKKIEILAKMNNISSDKQLQQMQPKD
jgi:hypothetical protein